jgi:hypothetical protein
MAQADLIVTSTHEDIRQILDLFEQAQAIAAARVQELQKVGGVAVIDAFDWSGVELDKSEFIAGILVLQNTFPDLLGTDGEALYTVKTKL